MDIEMKRQTVGEERAYLILWVGIVAASAVIILATGCSTGRVGKVVGPEVGAPLPVEPEKPSAAIAELDNPDTLVMIRNYNWVEPNQSITLAKDGEDLDVNGAVALYERAQGQAASMIGGAGQGLNAVAGAAGKLIERDRTGGFMLAAGDGEHVTASVQAYMNAQAKQQTQTIDAFSSVTFTGEYSDVAQEFVESISEDFKRLPDTLDHIKGLLERDEDGGSDADVVGGVVVERHDRKHGDGGTTDVGSNQVLWKGVSDTTGKAVFLAPASWNSTIKAVTANGESGRLASYANGNRSHWRWNHGFSGAVAIVVSFKDGSEKVFNVENGSKRVPLRQG